MLSPRLIPSLLLHENGLVKTRGFALDKYVGDPLNAVRIFNEKHVDELAVFDIDATVRRRGPNLELIRKLAAECRMPLCYGGGVKDVETVDAIISLGVEKVALSSAAIGRPDLVGQAASRVGSQSVVAVVDVKKTGLLRRYEVVTHNGCVRTGLDPLAWVRRLQDEGAGEIVLNFVDRDGEMQGYDLDYIARVREIVRTPMTVLGGAGSLADVESLVRRFGIVGAAAGSLFVFKGRLRAVLINYPNPDEKRELWRRALGSA